MSLKFLHNQTEVNLSSLPNGLLAIFTTKNNSEFLQTQLAYLQQKKEELKNLNMTVLFALDSESETSSEDVIIDQNREILNLSKKISEQNNLGENLVLFTKKDSEVIYSDTKENPENEYNWIEAMEQLAKNFANKEPDGDYWKWGQIVPETAEYLCKDCGYIEEFKAGSIFPICEVCIAGEPAGPSGPGEGFWEKI
jgi:hypothetical protein